jgi:hypothetical protein
MVASFDMTRSLTMILRRHFDNDADLIAMLDDLLTVPSTPVFQTVISRLLLEVKASPRHKPTAVNVNAALRAEAGAEPDEPAATNDSTRPR